MLARRKVWLTIIFIFAFTMLLSMVALAEEDEQVNVLQHYGISVANLQEMVNDVTEASFNSTFGYQYGLLTEQDETLKEFGSLSLTKGFTRRQVTTFSDEKIIEGFGKAGATVGLFVFQYEDVISIMNNEIIKKMVIRQQSRQTIGSSGLYTETIRLPETGVYYVMIAVEQIDQENGDNTVVKRLFKLTKKELATMNLLQNITVDFFNEKTETEIGSFVPMYPSIY